MTDKKPENPPAFPIFNASGQCAVYSGMTLRDYFAAAALQGMLSNPKVYQYGTHSKGDDCKYINSTNMAYFLTSDAYDYADSMLEDRKP